MASVSKARRRANPAVTRNGKARIKGLTVSQIETLMEKSNKPRDKDRLRSRLAVLQSR